MARTGIDSLNAGAPDLRLTGNIEMAAQPLPIKIENLILQYWRVSDDGNPTDQIQHVPKEFKDKVLKELGLMSSGENIQNRRMASAPDPTEMLDTMALNEFGKLWKDLTNEEKDWLQEIGHEEGRAPVEKRGIMQAAYGGTARPTYTQSRKQRMAYGGIAGLDGRKRYGIGSWFQEQKDKAEAFLFNKTPTQIDNESQVRVDKQDQIKRWDPRTGQEFNLQDYNPATDPPLNDQNFPRMEGHEGIPYTPWYDQLGGGGDGMPNIPSTGNDQLDQFISQYLPYSQPRLGEEQTRPLPFGLDFLGLTRENIKPYLQYKTKAEVAGQPGTPDEWKYPGPGGGDPVLVRGKAPIPEQAAQYESRVNPLWPVAGGLGAGLYTMMNPGEAGPVDTTGIDFSRFATAQAAKDDPNLRFKSLMSAAQGGRIGYDNGGISQLVKPGAGRPGYGGGDRGWKAQMRADEMAADLGYESYYDMPRNLRDKVYKAALLEIDDALADIADMRRKNEAQGGRIRAQEGGLMDLGGMEKDYRQEGGFVPIGGQEKADDVPARLSKNEFVFTADAVRAAGGGDIDKGAAVMERLMDNLEAGGKVSEKSQGLEGAQEMFANTQQLEKRII